MMKFRRILFILMILGVCGAEEQDIHFTQFLSSPLTLNPAFTGDYNGDYRVMNTFRSQWQKFDPGYTTDAVGYDQQIYIGGQRCSGGLNVVYDKSGINAMQTIKINLSFAWHKMLGKNMIHAGIQGGYVMKSIDVSKLTFPDQFNSSTGYFDQNIGSTEGDFNHHTDYADLNAGVAWNRTFGKHTPKLGFAFFHINTPNESFFERDNTLPMRSVITASDKWQLKENLVMTPQLLYMENAKANDFVLGVIMTTLFNNPEEKLKAVHYGAYLRNSINSKPDAVALMAGLRYNLFDFGLSYDINISDASVVTDNRGGFEISILYTALNTHVQKIRIPCDRY